MELDSSNIDEIFRALDAQIGVFGGTSINLVVCGGTALAALEPNEDELEAAAKWVLTQDVSETFMLILKDFLRKNGYEKVAEKI